jgi:hypothetical protein
VICSASEEGGRRWRKWLSGPLSGPAWLLCWAALIPFLYLSHFVFSYRVGVPAFDEWDLIPHIERLYEGRLTWGDLASQNFEHRLFFPRLIILACVCLSGWDRTWELTINLLLGAGIFLALMGLAARAARPLRIRGVAWIAPVISLIVFSPRHWENWMWGWQLQIFLSLLAVICAFALLTRDRLESPLSEALSLGGAVLCGVVATFSFGNGMLVWPLGLLALLLNPPGPARRRAGYLAVWGAAGLASAALYLYDWHPVSGHMSLLAPVRHPDRFGLYVLAYLGSPIVFSHPHPAAVIGAAGLLASVYLFWAVTRRHPAAVRRLSPFLLIYLYTLGSAVVTAGGRMGLGLQSALFSRYVILSSPFWVCLAVLAFFCLSLGHVRSTGATPWKTIEAAGLALLMAAGFCRLCVVSYQERGAFPAYYNWLKPVETALIQGDYATIRRVVPVHVPPAEAQRRIEILRRYRLTVFRR